MSAKKEKDIEIPLGSIREIKPDFDKGVLLIKTGSIPDAAQLETWRSWWMTNGTPALYGKIQIWFNERGATFSTEAGERVEMMGHSLAEDGAEGQLDDVLRSGFYGEHIPAETLFDFANSDARRAEQKANIGRWRRSFMSHFADIEANALSLSNVTRTELKAKVLQRRLRPVRRR